MPTWIKSTDILPQKNGQYCIREFANGTLCYSTDYFGMVGGHHDFYSRTGDNPFEWLDESPSTPPQDVQEAALIQALINGETLIRDYAIAFPDKFGYHIKGECVEELYCEISNGKKYFYVKGWGSAFGTASDRIESIIQNPEQWQLQSGKALAGAAYRGEAVDDKFEFTEWVANNYQWGYTDPLWRANADYNAGIFSTKYTTAQLFELFLTNKQKP